MLRSPITLSALASSIALIACGGGDADAPGADGAGKDATVVNTKAELIDANYSRHKI